MEAAFYKDELRLHGETLWTKSRMVNKGDTLDLHTGEDEEARTGIIMMWISPRNFKNMFAKHLICT